MEFNRILALGLRRIEQELREAVYIRTDFDVTRPHVIQAIPTERCNYKCLSCSCWRADQYPRELTLDEWTQALLGLKRFVGPYTVQFGGGEPFVFKPFVPLVEWCHAQGIDWGVITNGSAFTPSIVERVVAARPLNVSISVDGASAAVHDRSRGIAGSLDRIARGIVQLREERDRRGASFPIRIKPTVHRLNFREMPALLRWTQDVGADTVDFSPVRPATPEVESMLWLQPEDEAALTEVIETLIDARRRGAPIETDEPKLRGFIGHFKGEVVLPSVAPCRAGMREFHILPNGDVRTCWFYPSIGSVLDDDPQTLWQGTVAAEQRSTQLQCSRFGSKDCASSCLAHRTLAQDWKRLLVMTRKSH
jgi:MoaA/NifB/PqqE/SkfB family radical SAM enzyme